MSAKSRMCTGAGAAAIAMLAVCAAGCAPRADDDASVEVLRRVVEGAARGTAIEQVVVDADIASRLPQSAPGLPPLSVGAADLERSSRSLREGQLAITQFSIEGDHAEVETRTVTGQTHAPNSGLDCGERQTMRLVRKSGEWSIQERQLLRC